MSDGRLSAEAALDERQRLVSCSPAVIEDFLVKNPPEARLAPVSTCLLQLSDSIPLVLTLASRSCLDISPCFVKLLTGLMADFLAAGGEGAGRWPSEAAGVCVPPVRGLQVIL